MSGQTGNRRGAQRWLGALALSMIALVGVSVVLYSAWPASSTKTAGNSSGVAASSPSQRTPASADSPAGAAGSQAKVPNSPAAPMILRPSHPAHVATWKAGQGGATLAAISTHLGTALMAHGAGRFMQMRQACVSLASDVESASTQPPIPDSAMQSLYSKALASLAAGATKCKSGISSTETGEDIVIHTNPALVEMAISELDAGVNKLYSATEKIKTIRKR